MQLSIKFKFVKFVRHTIKNNYSNWPYKRESGKNNEVKGSDTMEGRKVSVSSESVLESLLTYKLKRAHDFIT